MRKLSLLSAAFLGLCMLSACGGGSPSLAPPPPLALEITSGPLPSGTSGAAYGGATGFPLTASGGIAPYKWSWAAAASSSLPPGITLTNTTISGTPTAAGSYNVIVTVADSESPQALKSATYVVSIDMPLAITSDAPPGGAVGVNYGTASTEYLKCVWSPVGGWHWSCNPCNPSGLNPCPTIPCSSSHGLKACVETKQVFPGFTLTATGGVSPYLWSASGLPPGLNLDPNTSNISGTPTTAGSYEVSVTASDSESPPAQVTMTYTVGIDDASSQK
jgi:large repetitive protein